MKKKRWFILILGIMALSLFGTAGMKAEAASKTETRKKVYKAITGVKSGKYTYYTDGKAVYRENSKGKKTKLSKYPADGGFVINGNYIYYHSRTKNRMYRMTKAGKSQKKYSVSSSRIRAIKGGYIYYNNALGLNRIKTSGSTKTKAKLLSYPNNYDSHIIGNRIYYSRTKITNKEDGTQEFKSYIQSVNLKGKDKKTHIIFENADNIEITGDDRYLYSSVKYKNGYELGVIDTKTEGIPYTKLQYYDVAVNDSEFIDETERYVPIVVFDNMLYFQNEDYLYQMNPAGEVKEIIKMPTENVQGVKLEKKGNYYWLEFYGDDTFGLSFVYNKKWELAKKLTQKHGDVIDLNVKGKKLYVVFNRDESINDEEKYKTYKIYTLKK